MASTKKPQTILVPKYKLLTVPRVLGRAREDVKQEIARMGEEGWTFLEVTDTHGDHIGLRFEKREPWTVDELLDDVAARTTALVTSRSH